MSSEETRQRFRNLVTGVFMNDFSYTEVPLSFKTVFYMTPYSYRCCPCAYEFEYLDFISDTGGINEAMFEKILQSLTDKQCPHVDSTTDRLVDFTTIYGIHIAAALESDEVIQRYQHDWYWNSPAGLLGMTPCCVAILKGKPKSLHAMLNMYPIVSIEYVYVYRSEEDQNSIRFIKSSFLEQCVRKDNPDLLNTFINWTVENYRSDMNMSNALKVAITHKHLECESILLQSMKMFADDCDNGDDCSDIIDCGAIAIIHNRFDVLVRVLHVLSTLKRTGEYKSKLSNLCIRLPRPKCKNVLEALGISCLKSEPIEDTVHGLLRTLVEYLDCDSDEIVTILKSIPGIEAIINSVDKKGQTALNLHLKYKLDYKFYINCDPSPKPKIVKLLLDLGSDISLPFLDNETPLKLLLRERVGQDTIFYENLRWTVEMLLNENPEFEKHSDERSDTIAQLALKLDMALLSQRCVLVRDTPTLMKMNNSEISHSRHAGGSKNVLNFLLPLLIECGYQANRDNLLEANRESLFPAEYEYIQRVLDTPRGLKMLCRDFLRNHFKGRKIWNYVEMIYAPESIKSFILLKKELLMLNE